VKGRIGGLPLPVEADVEIVVLQQALPDRREDAEFHPALEAAMDRGARAILARHRLPLSPRAQHVQDAIEHPPRLEPPPPTRRADLFDREQDRDAIPQLIRHTPDCRDLLPLASPPHRHLPVVATFGGVVLRAAAEI
jgi:hypothetical protein